jgi:hypothetical protein
MTGLAPLPLLLIPRCKYVFYVHIAHIVQASTILHIYVGTSSSVRYIYSYIAPKGDH